MMVVAVIVVVAVTMAVAVIMVVAVIMLVAMIMLVAVIMLVAMIMSATYLSSGVKEIEKTENNHSQPSTQCNEVKGLTQILANKAFGIEIDRNYSPRDCSETRDDLIEGRLGHRFEALVLCRLGEGGGLITFKTFKNRLKENTQCSYSDEETCSEDKDEFSGQDRAVEEE